MSKTILITGGTRGIGAQLTRLALAEGNKVIATGRTAKSVNAARTQLPDVDWHLCDMVDAEQVAQLTNTLKRRELALAEKIDILIHNAGVQIPRPYFLNKSHTGTAKAGEPQASEAITSISSALETTINFSSPVQLTEQVILQGLLNPSGSHIVFVTSGLAIAPKQSSPVYCANKASLRVYSQCLRQQVKMAKQPIVVQDAIMPLVDTDMTRGRGKGKISAMKAAKQLLAGIKTNKAEIRIGASKALMLLHSLAPTTTNKLLIKQ